MYRFWHLFYTLKSTSAPKIQHLSGFRMNNHTQCKISYLCCRHSSLWAQSLFRLPGDYVNTLDSIVVKDCKSWQQLFDVPAVVFISRQLRHVWRNKCLKEIQTAAEFVQELVQISVLTSQVLLIGQYQSAVLVLDTHYLTYRKWISCSTRSVSVAFFISECEHILLLSLHAKSGEFQTNPRCELIGVASLNKWSIMKEYGEERSHCPLTHEAKTWKPLIIDTTRNSWPSLSLRQYLCGRTNVPPLQLWTEV